jgi:hypothetical protein
MTIILLGLKLLLYKYLYKGCAYKMCKILMSKNEISSLIIPLTYQRLTINKKKYKPG